MYVVYFNTGAHPQIIDLAYNAQDQNNNWRWTSLSEQPFTFQSDQWYTLRLEARNDQFTVDIDNYPTISTSDTRLQQGRLYLELGPGAVIEFDDIKIGPLD